MHEHGLIDRLVRLALAEALERGGRLRAVHVRLGCLATHTPEGLRREFDHITREHLGHDVALVVEEAPDRPSGIEIVGIEVVS